MRRRVAGAVVVALCLGGRVLAATKIVDVGPGGTLTFSDEETGTATTTIDAGDSVEWVWKSSGHSTTSDRPGNGWDSGVQSVPFTFLRQFSVPGTYPYHCIPHQSFGMVGRVVVRSTGMATTTTTVSTPVQCGDEAAVVSTRAAIEAQCVCAGARNHGAYVRCAMHVIGMEAKAGVLPTACKRAVKRCAARSACGRAGFVTCCRTSVGGRTNCSVKRSGAACRKPKGASACAGTQASCCDACTATGCAP